MENRVIKERSEAGNALVNLFISFCLLFVGAGLVLSVVTGSPDEDENRIMAAEKKVDKDESVETTKPPAPEFRLKDTSGKEVKLSDFKGEIVVVNFWATWCGPCLMEIPSLVKLREQYHDKGVEIVAISLNQNSPKQLARFARDFNINYPVVIGTEDVVEAFGPVNAIPTTIIIDREGQVYSRHTGLISFDEAERSIQPLL